MISQGYYPAHPYTATFSLGFQKSRSLITVVLKSYISKVVEEKKVGVNVGKQEINKKIK